MGQDDICKRFMSIRRVIYDVKKTEQSDFAEKQKNKKMEASFENQLHSESDPVTIRLIWKARC